MQMAPHSIRWVATAACALAVTAGAWAADVAVRNVDGLRQAVVAAKPGTRILLAPGDYPGALYFADVKGEPGKPIVIGAADPQHPPRLVGGGNNLQLSEVAYVELRDLVMTGATGNGLNIDDGGTFETPSHHILLQNLTVTNVGPTGNRDGIKLSGIDDFRIRDCTLRRWGDGGQGIDMVGCHRGMIDGCTLSQGPGVGGEGIQAKGGSAGIVVCHNRFEDAGLRGVNAGGSTGLAFFRPKVQGYEARSIVVEENVFVGCQAPIAFVGVDGAVARHNTLYHPGKWAIRILQETTEPGFVPCRNGVFSDNIVVFRSDAWAEGGVNIGPNTAPQTFRFARNVWYCDDQPDRSRPTLPAPETDGLAGKDPLFRDPARGDFSLREGSPAAGRGAAAAARR